ncbi:tetratricopeptide repeat protein [Marinicellulosiphila megalodicopiae]|uniref:tetratricopeptide repeat protein n=1 Tax=Marinicellulosiphila megalodicopiae TaxID=2724896 RepID=UPI003BAFFC57
MINLPLHLISLIKHTLLDIELLSLFRGCMKHFDISKNVHLYCIILFTLLISQTSLAQSESNTASVTSESTLTSTNAQQYSKLRKLATEYQSNKQYKESIVLYLSLLKIKPNDLTLRLDLALSYFYTQQYELAKIEIETVTADKSFANAPDQVKTNVGNLYQTVLSMLLTLSEQNLDQPNEELTNPDSINNINLLASSTITSISNATQIPSELNQEKQSLIGIGYSVFLNHEYYHPDSPWKFEQTFNLHQNKDFYSVDDVIYSIINTNYDVELKRILDSNQLIGLNFSIYWIKSDSFMEPSILSQFNYNWKKQQFSAFTKHHWQSYETYIEDTDNNNNIFSEQKDNFWIIGAQYQSSLVHRFKSLPNELSLNWKSKISSADSDTQYVRLEQFIGAAYEFNQKLAWATQFYTRFQVINKDERTDLENRFLNKLSYKINDQWLLYLTQQYKYKTSTDVYFQYNQWKHQLTLQWVN